MKTSLALFKKILTLTWLILTLCANGSKGNEHEVKGIRFKTKEFGIENRTGLDATRYGHLHYSGAFIIRFDIRFRSFPSTYGSILHLKDKAGTFHLNLMSQIDEDDPDLFMLLNKKLTSLQIALPEEQRVKMSLWHSIEIDVDTKTGLCTLKLDETIVQDSLSIPQNGELMLAFGTVDNYNLSIKDVPAMSVKNIEYINNGIREHYWPLYPTQKNIIKDSLQNKKLAMHNAEWERLYHQKWEGIYQFNTDGMPQVAYNSQKEVFYFILNDGSIKTYDLNTERLEQLRVNGVPQYEDAQQVCFNQSGDLITYSFANNSISVFDDEHMQWINPADTLQVLPNYWHHNKFISPISNKLTTFGGYGHYTYFNLCQQFNIEKMQWQQINMLGDEIAPRYLSAAGTDGTGVYLFGGLGNLSGKQVEGSQYYYDLYKLNLETNVVHKLWQLKQPVNADFTPINSMLIDSVNQAFYTLTFPHNKRNTHLQLVKGSLQEPKLECYANKIPYKFQDIKSFANLYKWQSQNRIIALTIAEQSKGIYQVNLHSLNFPPVHLFIAQSHKEYASIIIVGVMVTALLLVIIVVKKRKPKRKTNTPLAPVKDELKKDKAKILLFGGLGFVKSNGEDITHRFTPVLQDLFLLILLHSRNGNNGISSVNISETLWPDKPAQSAKNNRGVNINKLRLLLEELGDVKVVYDKNVWRITHGKNIFYDLDFIMDEINKRKTSTTLRLNCLLKHLQRGEFLQTNRNELLDNFKDKYTGIIINYLEEICITNSHTTQLMQLIDTLFIFDRLNETALKLKCKVLYEQGKHSLALDTYKHFAAMYRKLYNEDYAVDFKALLK